MIPTAKTIAKYTKENGIFILVLWLLYVQAEVKELKTQLIDCYQTKATAVNNEPVNQLPVQSKFNSQLFILPKSDNDEKEDPEHFEV